MQKKFDDFQSDLKANEVRLAEMNEIAMQLMSLGQTEAALKIQTQLQVTVNTLLFSCHNRMKNHHVQFKSVFF